MAPKRQPRATKNNASAGTGRTIDTGGGAYVEGDTTVISGKFVGRDDRSQTGISSQDFASLFETIYRQIEARPQTATEDKADLKSDVKEIEQKIINHEEMPDNFLERRLRNIRRIAPDILEVVVTTLSDPKLGLATVIRKIQEKAKV